MLFRSAPKPKKNSPKVAYGKSKEARAMSTKFLKQMENTPAPAQDFAFGRNASTSKVYQWQYNGRAPFGDIVEWCYNHLYHGGYYEPNWYTNERETIYFRDEKEYTMFLLRWS